MPGSLSLSLSPPPPPDNGRETRGLGRTPPPPPIAAGKRGDYGAPPSLSLRRICAGVVAFIASLTLVGQRHGLDWDLFLVAAATGALVGLIPARIRVGRVQVSVRADTIDELDLAQQAVADERTLIAADIHDGPVQSLTASVLRLDMAMTRLPGQAQLATVQAGLRDTIEELRLLMTQLRPPVLDERGLSAALCDHLRTVQQRTGLAVVAVIDHDLRLPRQAETVLYRVAQEALLNVVRHAQAQKVEVTLTSSGTRHVTLEVRDDGQGFHSSAATRRHRQGHFGLLAMHERIRLAHGQFHCTSQPGIGTTIRATLPLEPRDDQPSTGGTGAHPRHHSEYRLPEEDFGHVHALAQSQH